MSALPKRLPASAVLRDIAMRWIAWLQFLLLRLAAFATAIFVEPWAPAAAALRSVLAKMTEIPQDDPAPRRVAENSAMRRHPHVLNAATNLLGICFIIIGGLKLTNQNSRTWSDEVAWAAAFFLVVSIATSYFGIRNGVEREWRSRLADGSFLVGIAALIVAMVIAAYQL
jgi:hypothetical protein